MLGLHKRLIDEKKVSDTTATAYMKTLYMLNGKKPFTSLSFLKKTAPIMTTIGGYADSTQKTLVASIASILSLDKEKTGFKKCYMFYYTKMMEKSKEAKLADTSEKTEKQKESWIEWKDVEEKHKTLRETLIGYGNPKVFGEDQYETLLNLLVLSLYHDMPPRRNQDFLSMVIYRATKKDDIDALPKDKNYLIVSDNGKCPRQFIFNVYKTSKTYGQQQVNVPSLLTDTLLTYLKHHPLAKDKKCKEFPFLVAQNGKALDADNTITRILNKIFGKSVGSSMLRHIYLSGKYDITQMKEDAEMMGHSLSQQREYLKADGSSPASSQSADTHTAPLPEALPQALLPQEQK